MEKVMRSKSRPEGDPDQNDVALAKDGDHDAFGRIYDRNVARVNSLAEWMLGGIEVEDALQEIFIRAWDKLKLFDGNALFSTWLRRVAVNTLIRIRANRNRWDERHVRDDSIESMPDRRGNLQIFTDIENAVRNLPQQTRDVFVLHDFEGYKHSEIAELLEMPVGTCRWQLHSARMTLRKNLQ
jgi:RNA polymerase sigma-70 factor (ECF subfamily)